MIVQNIHQYLKEQNFALATTNIPDINIFRNVSDGRGIFCVVIDNTKGQVCNLGIIESLKKTLESQHFPGVDYGSINDVLFIDVTSDPLRDRIFTNGSAQVWLADSSTGCLMIFDGQPGDFYGLKAGIERCIYSGFQGKPEKSRSFLSQFPVVTTALIAANVIYFIVCSLLGSTRSTGFMLNMGASYGPYIFEKFQLWRLFTAMFMHFGISHLASNMIYLAIAGYNLEHALGRWKFLLIYMLSGLGAGLVSAAYYYITGANAVSAGASGAIYGLIGAIALLTFSNFRRMKPTYIFWRIGVIIVFVFYSSFMSTGVDGAAHIGGFLFGILLILLFSRGKNNEKR